MCLCEVRPFESSNASLKASAQKTLGVSASKCSTWNIGLEKGIFNKIGEELADSRGFLPYSVPFVFSWLTLMFQ